MEEDIVCKTTSECVASCNYDYEFNFLVGNDFGMIYFLFNVSLLTFIRRNFLLLFSFDNLFFYNDSMFNEC